MDNEAITNKIQFTKSTTDQGKGAFTTELISRKSKINTVQEHENKYYKKYELKSDDEEFLKDYIATAKAKLESLGISNTDSLLPSIDQIVVFDSLEDTETGGATGEYGDYIRIDKPQSLKITDNKFKATFFHEFSHFITRKVIKISEEEGETSIIPIASGFNRSRQDKLMAGFGVNNEPLAELFSLYCLGNNVVIETPYSVQLPFYMSLIRSYTPLPPVCNFVI